MFKVILFYFLLQAGYQVDAHSSILIRESINWTSFNHVAAYAENLQGELKKNKFIPGNIFDFYKKSSIVYSKELIW